MSVASGAIMFSFGLRGLLWRIAKPIVALFLKRLYARVQINEDYLSVQKGILLRRRICIPKNNIICFCVDRGPLMRITRLCTVSIMARGETDGRDIRIIALPVCSVNEADFVEKSVKEKLLPEKDTIRCVGEQFFKKRTAIFRKRDIGAVFIYKYVFSRKCKLKLKLRSDKRNTVKLYGIEPQRADKVFNLIKNMNN